MDLKVEIEPLESKEEPFLMPKKAHNSDAAFDLYYQGTSQKTILAGERCLIPCGFRMGFLSEGWEAQIRPRSGLALKSGITVLNSPGTIDSSYTGPVGVILINTSDKAFVVNHGDRIAQMKFARVYDVELKLVEKLSVSTDRGEGGFGSTGVNDGKV